MYAVILIQKSAKKKKSKYSSNKFKSQYLFRPWDHCRAEKLSPCQSCAFITWWIQI